MKYYIQDVILDEASLLRAPLLPILIPMVKTGLRKVVLVGDSRQNSPYGSTPEKQVAPWIGTLPHIPAGSFLSSTECNEGTLIRWKQKSQAKLQVLDDIARSSSIRNNVELHQRAPKFQGDTLLYHDTDTVYL